MILQGTVRETFTTGIEETSKMHLGRGIESHLIRLVTEFSYKRPLASSIREQASNGIDAHLEAGQTDPVIVSLKQNINSKWELTIEDFGTGLDNKEFDKYIMGIGESTKRDNPLAIGGFGGGSKSILAYTSSYFYTCRKNGVERKFMVFKGSTLPESMLIHEQATEERNGVKVSFELTSNNEYYNCVEAIKEQLAYLPNIYFDVEGVDNTYKIHKNSLFQWNTLHPVQELHISLKGIFYPLDWRALGMSAIYLPVAIIFEDYDHIRPVYTREEIQWDEEAKKVVKEKIKEVCNWFIIKYNDDAEVIKLEDLPTKFNYLNPNNSKTVTIEGEKFDINGLDKYGTIKFAQPKIEGIEVFNIGQLWSGRNYYLLDDYSVVARTNYGKCSSTRSVQSQNSFNALCGRGDYRDDYKKWLLTKETPRGVYGEFLADSLGKGVVVFIQSSKARNLYFFKQNWYLKSYPKKDWRKFIEEYYKIRQVFIDKMEPIENYPITEEWKAERKANRKKSTNIKRTHVKKEEVNLRQIVYGTKKYILAAGKIIETTSLDSTGINIYGLKEEMDNMETLVRSLSIPCYVTSERDVERIKEQNLPNWMSYEEFMKGDTEYFKSVCLPHKYYDQWTELLSTEGKFLAKIDEDFEAIVPMLQSKIKNRKDNYWIKNTMLSIAKTKDWWNTSLDGEYEKAINKLNNVDLSFLNYIYTQREDGMNIAKELYYARLEKQEQLFGNLSARYV